MILGSLLLSFDGRTNTAGRSTPLEVVDIEATKTRIIDIADNSYATQFPKKSMPYQMKSPNDALPIISRKMLGRARRAFGRAKSVIRTSRADTYLFDDAARAK